MRITCPECGFSRQVPDGKIPASSAIATCPKCRCRFKFRDAIAPVDVDDPDAAFERSIGRPVRPARLIDEAFDEPRSGAEADPESGGVSEEEAPQDGRTPEEQAHGAPSDPLEDEAASASGDALRETDDQEAGAPAHGDDVSTVEKDFPPEITPEITPEAPLEATEQKHRRLSPFDRDPEPGEYPPPPRATWVPEPDEDEDEAAAPATAAAPAADGGTSSARGEALPDEDEPGQKGQDGQDGELEESRDAAWIRETPAGDDAPRHAVQSPEGGGPAGQPDQPGQPDQADQEDLEDQAGQETDGVRDIWARLQAMDEDIPRDLGGRKTGRRAAPSDPGDPGEPGEPADEAEGADMADPADKEGLARPARPSGSEEPSTADESPRSGKSGRAYEPPEPFDEDAADDVEDAGVPWERPEQGGFITAFALTLKKILFQPVDFFESMAPGRGVARSMVFYLVLLEFMLLVDFLWIFIGAQTNLLDASQMAALNLPDVSGPGFLIALILTPLFFAGGLSLFALVLHGLLVVFQCAKRGMGETFRVVFYGTAPIIFYAVPVTRLVMLPVVVIWIIALQAIGLKKAQGGPYANALAAIFIVWSICMFAFGALLKVALPGFAA